MDFEGFGWAVFSIAGARRGARYRVSLGDQGGKTIQEESLEADASGVVLFKRRLPAPRRAYRLKMVLEGTAATTGRTPAGGPGQTAGSQEE